MQMNVQLHHVVTDVVGLPGMDIIRDVIAARTYSCKPFFSASRKNCKASAVDYRSGFSPADYRQ